MQQILKIGDPDPAATVTATVTDSLHNEVITKLRQQYLEYDARVSDWTRKYGAAHLAVVNLRNQMQELRRTMVTNCGVSRRRTRVTTKLRKRARI